MTEDEIEAAIQPLPPHGTRELRRCKAYNEVLTKFMIGMLSTIETKGVPNAATLKAAIGMSLREAYKAAMTVE